MVAMRFRPAKHQRLVWSFGMILDHSSSSSPVADLLAPLLGQSSNAVRKRLRDTYREVGGRRPENLARNLMPPCVGHLGGHGY